MVPFSQSCFVHPTVLHIMFGQAKMSQAECLNILESSCFASSTLVLKQPAADTVQNSLRVVLDTGMHDMLKHDYIKTYPFENFSAMHVQFNRQVLTLYV